MLAVARSRAADNKGKVRGLDGLRQPTEEFGKIGRQLFSVDIRGQFPIFPSPITPVLNPGQGGKSSGFPRQAAAVTANAPGDPRKIARSGSS